MEMPHIEEEESLNRDKERRVMSVVIDQVKLVVPWDLQVMTSRRVCV